VSSKLVDLNIDEGFLPFISMIKPLINSYNKTLRPLKFSIDTDLPLLLEDTGGSPIQSCNGILHPQMDGT
jgi:hypothetical protein